MNIFQVLETTCSTDVSSCCSDYGIAMFLYIMRNALTLIQIVVPILLLVMATIQMIKMMISPDDKKQSKSLLNKFIAAIFVFFTPFIINLALSILPDGFEISACWKSAEGIVNTMQSSTQYGVVHKKDNRTKTEHLEKYKITKGDSSASAGYKIANYASQFVGNPYIKGGGSLTDGCDASHFVFLVLKNVGAYDGNYVTSSNWAKLGKKVKGGLKNARAGDVVVYKGHVGIYDGEKYLIEAKGGKYGITQDRTPQDCKKKLLDVRRFV